MIESLFTLPAVMARHRQEPFGSYIDGFTEHLSSQGYSHSKVRHAVEVVSRFGRWLHSHKHGAGHVSRRTIEGFGQKHLLSSLTRCGGQAALYSLLEYLQLIEVTAKPDPVPKESEPIRIEREFSHFLQEERALSSATVKNYSPIARLFLVERFGRRHVELSKLSPCDVHDFISRHAHEYSRQRTQLILTALRSFLRFLYLRGRITAQLGNHVLTVAGWRMSTVPKWLNADDIERVVGCCDYQAESGQRDHAILLLLARLGLRAGEIVALELEDVRWDAGEITVCGKGQQRKRFPLPEDVGHVLASYLKNARPQCSTRRIFSCNSLSLSTTCRAYRGSLHLPEYCIGQSCNLSRAAAS